jgi:hypothetical protein
VERNNAYCVGGSYQIFNLNCCFSLVSIDVELLTAYSVSDDIDWERPEPGLKKTGNGVRKSWVDLRNLRKVGEVLRSTEGLAARQQYKSRRK